MEHDLNPNLLRSWIARYQKIQARLEHELVARTPAISDGVAIDLPNAPSAFVPVVAAPPSSPALLQSRYLRFEQWHYRCTCV